ncbi:MAG: tripartite tricarboxylate transporter permease [Deltaproteobacteria bacterium]|nr:tripartite tricarboxylate transporter permease [Deltaproteobacteria bacterium]
MDTLHGLFYGFSVALQPGNLSLVFAGCLLGTLIGVLPGIGPVGAISILLPLTFHMPSTGAIIMLAGIYYGAMYGGSTTSILINIPGETASVMTCLDGYQMARQGRAGPALGMTAFGSFIAGTAGLIGLIFIAEPLAKLALKFGPAEYFAIILMGFTFVTYLSQGSMVKACMMAFAGLLLSCVGLDPVGSEQRMTFGRLNLFEGIGVAPLAMGLFGVAEVFNNLKIGVDGKLLDVKIKPLFPDRRDWRQSRFAILRGTVIGFFMGILPGGGPVLATFMAYGVEKRVAKEPERLGRGAIEGVAAPESANNAAASTSFIPLLTLGIPPNVILAVLFGAFLIHGVQPGPFLIKDHPDLFWGVIGSMYIGNVMLLLLNLPLIPLWVQVLRIPDRILYPLILLFCLVGAYSINNNVFDVVVMIIFGIAGYLLKKFDYETAPLILAFVLGPMLEVNLRRALLMSKGSFSIFFTRPIALGAVGASLILVLLPAYQTFKKWKRPRQQD